MNIPHFTPAHLIPSDIEAYANRLAEHVAGIHLETGEYSEMTITIEDVVIDDYPAGDYEVIVRQKKPASFLELEAKR
ncbi:hypothetical protein LJR098_000563 [Rhizobium sp. LjRoot98]|uniref:hypothetical protein n=1 Tax=unclassified Rhizobium TaxID=2613769 RepID=UPI0007151B05|nr:MULTISPECIES: hypothetical protein [unclassified Rhizobium]KQV37427.1 hypothetical protein ASC96_05025 [Rhizobium sp. Root1204]KQY17440.1 hypothetical protein ASD36_01925 [Rhizobium sp. Root1334]KRC13321.1 hypothetical protein ASE23_01925 [Rhizobium sp. Root73]